MDKKKKSVKAELESNGIQEKVKPAELFEQGSQAQAVFDYPKAIELFSSALDKKGVSPELAYEMLDQRSECHGRLGQFKEELEDLDQMVSIGGWGSSKRNSKTWIKWCPSPRKLAMRICRQISCFASYSLRGVWEPEIRFMPSQKQPKSLGKIKMTSRYLPQLVWPSDMVSGVLRKGRKHRKILSRPCDNIEQRVTGKEKATHWQL